MKAELQIDLNLVVKEESNILIEVYFPDVLLPPLYDLSKRSGILFSFSV